MTSADAFAGSFGIVYQSGMWLAFWKPHPLFFCFFGTDIMIIDIDVNEYHSYCGDG